jgi:DNA-binding NarL/FixJ family response regulator
MIKVLAVDAQEISRKHMVQTLSRYGELTVVAEARNFHDALRIAATHEVDLAIVELMMVGCDGFELIRALLSMRPAMKILVISARLEETTVARALHMGAGGYMAKGGEPEDIIAAIRTVAAGGRYVCPRISQKIALTTLLSRSGYTRRGDTLTSGTHTSDAREGGTSRFETA